MEKEELQEIKEIADKIVEGARNSLMLQFRFLYKSLSFLEHECTEEVSTFGTDGKFIFYNPYYVIETYKKDKEKLKKIYLHSIFHCVFRHFHTNPSIQKEHWNLAADIAVEHTIYKMNHKKGEIENKNTYSEMHKIEQNVKYMTAEHIYHYFVKEDLSAGEIERLGEIFYTDEHNSWYEKRKEKPSLGEKGEEREEREGNGKEGEKEKKNLAKKWKEIAETMKVELDNFSKERGYESGGLKENLEIANRKKVDYASFLRKFSVMGEAMKVNDEEFDTIFYTYGLKLYEKMPLIEPLEYKEVKRVKEFVIAIDTSGSVYGEMVKKFLERTYDILMNEESFFTKINLHIIQCDARVQKDVKITNREEFEDYMKQITLFGFGGTDFRPVFHYVDELVGKKEFTNLKGLIYFTDGYGEFPVKKPDYQTAFLISGDFRRVNNFVKVPDWAILLNIEEEDFER